MGELLGATWADAAEGLDDMRSIADRAEVKVGFVDLARGAWHIPVTKNQRSHTIPLSDFARAQLRKLQALRTSTSGITPSLSPWIFSNEAGDGPVGVKTLGKQLSDRQREAKGPLRGRSKATTSLALPDGRRTAHDLRRTAATFMAAPGISGDVIDECLNHVIESRVRRTYIRVRRIVQQAQAFDALGRFIDGLVQASSQTSSSRPTTAIPSRAGRFALPRGARFAL